MKKYIKPSKFLQQLIVVFGIFMMLPTVTLAQEKTREQIKGRIANIDKEIRKLTYGKEAIGLEFEEISNFSMKVRPILLGYNQTVEAIKLKDDEYDTISMWKHELRKKNNGEYQSLIAKRDNYLKQFKNSGGVMGYFGFKCNTIRELQDEYTRTVYYYQDKKKEYDNIAFELGNLNTERQILALDLQYMVGWTESRIFDLEGCWNLRTGKYVSQIVVYPDNELYAFHGYLEINNLENYQNNQLMFSVNRVDGRTFRGVEYSNYVDDNGNTSQKQIPVIITINSDDNFLTWTSDETVTMQRCN